MADDSYLDDYLVESLDEICSPKHQKLLSLDKLEIPSNVPDEYLPVYEALKEGHNILLSGAAGTGKSTFLKYFKANKKKLNIIVVAPTGIAALNVGGQTVHSFFYLKPSVQNSTNMPSYSRKGFDKIDLIIIDEISMVRADIIDAIDKIMRKNGRSSSFPFGGTKMLFIGDLYQLPPVVSNSESEFYNELYDTPFFFSSGAYKDSNFKKIELTKIYRQNDKRFINMLNRVRIGDIDEDLIDDLNTRIFTKDNIEKVRELSPMILTARTATADRINNKSIDALKTELKEFNGVIKGDFNVSEDKLPAPINLKIKEGAKVMFVKNDTNKRWVNGTIGRVVGFEGSYIKVKIKDEIEHVEKASWERYKHSHTAKENMWKQKVIGSYTQYPLMLAWANTIHKCQGRTLDSVFIDLEGGAFASGQLYVALSRCKTFDNLYLKFPVRLADIRVDRTVMEFMDEV